MLLVPGKVTNPETENYDQCYARSQDEIRKVIPQADDANVKIAIEVVWNDFITKPEQLVAIRRRLSDADRRRLFRLQQHAQVRRAVGHLDSPAGQADAQVRLQGLQPQEQVGADRRGDEDWPEVLKALDEIGYDGWATSEVAGGGEKELREIAERMNRVLDLS